MYSTDNNDLLILSTVMCECTMNFTEYDLCAEVKSVIT